MADRAKGLPIAREGVPFVALTGLPAVLALWWGWSTLSMTLLLVSAYTAWFFRNPTRAIPEGEHVLVSPADGKVVAVEQEFEPKFLKDHAIRVSIFLNIFNVHINRTPCAGMVLDCLYQPGCFIAANRPEASIRNEQNAILIERTDGKKILCVQIAGLIARRIVCWVTPGERVAKGERFGLIRFGSRVDLFVPHYTHVTVKVGDSVYGGTSIIGELV
ncbi:MAG: phosphatidylserine decarboxylase family protein [Nitrospirae bacterium]|nr:MAG: phosphatidylserine decarboxylase family protein [Nitrospirota bacterium]